MTEEHKEKPVAVILDNLKIRCIIDTDKTCCGCPECSWQKVQGKSYMLPDRNSQTCLSCATGRMFFYCIYGVCSITKEYCITAGQCTEKCPYYDEQKKIWKIDN